MVTALWLGPIVLYMLLRRGHAFLYRSEWNGNAVRPHIGAVLKRFAVLAPLLLLFTWLYAPGKLFAFPLERPHVWAMVMVLYPVLSVWPQEFIYRSYLFHRYRPLWEKPDRYLLASALAFAWAHLVFFNWIALSFTFAGGWMFAQTYRRSRSLALVCIEHALYGCLVFTLGLGWYFYATAWKPV
jgi:membrane protease YdiL (CAAX protease family)